MFKKIWQCKGSFSSTLKLHDIAQLFTMYKLFIYLRYYFFLLLQHNPLEPRQPVAACWLGELTLTASAAAQQLPRMLCVAGGSTNSSAANDAKRARTKKKLRSGDYKNGPCHCSADERQRTRPLECAWSKLTVVKIGKEAVRRVHTVKLVCKSNWFCNGICQHPLISHKSLQV